MTQRIKSRLCHYCGYMVDTVGSASGPDLPPKENDLCLCMNCGAPSMMHAGEWVPMTQAEREALSPVERFDLWTHELARRSTITHDLSRKQGGRS